MKSEFFSKYQLQLIGLGFLFSFWWLASPMTGLLASQPHDHLQTHESDLVGE